ncbi:hypothetical protein ABAC402_10305 [Asticcacaulis sp. AC402]|nr:hypothetical protein ABAC402_10305 [Asticcacaulis sp. AC402]
MYFPPGIIVASPIDVEIVRSHTIDSRERHVEFFAKIVRES